MKKLYKLILAPALIFSSIAIAQSDKQVVSTITSAQRQAILANVIDGSSTNANQAKMPLACDSLSVATVAGNGYHGNMFDISVTASTTLQTFSVSVDAGTWNIAVFYKMGTFVGSESSSTGWIFLDSANVTSTTTAAAGVFYKVPVNLNMALNAGSTYAFYVTGTSSAMTMNYTDGTAVGNVFSSNANFSVKEGNGGAYPFNVINSPRVFNGQVFYCNGIVGIDENSDVQSFDMYPNPANGVVTIDLSAFNGSKVNVSIYNTLGQRLQTNSLTANNTAELNIEGFSAGIYFVQVELNGKTTTSKLIVK